MAVDKHGVGAGEELSFAVFIKEEEVFPGQRECDPCFLARLQRNTAEALQTNARLMG